ncbi:MAG: ATP-binding protein, partial [Thermoanaerobaculia bacterium]
MSRASRTGVLSLLLALTAGTIGLAFLSFGRKVDTFSTAGFTYGREGGSIQVESVDPGGAAARAGLKPGDRVITIDGQVAASLRRPEKSLAREPFPHRLVVLSGSDMRGVEVGRPAVRVDRTYLFLAFVGFLYLLIGLFTAAKERGAVTRVFWALCLSTFAVYVITPVGPRDAIWKASWLAEDFFRALLPALLLHLFLIFPRAKTPRFLIPLLYAPAAAYLVAQIALLRAEGPRAASLQEGATRLWLVYFLVYAVAVVARLVKLLATRREDPEVEKQVRWIGLGVAVGLAPFLILSVLPRALGFESPLLSSVAVVPLVFIPLAFAYAILKWRLWDVEMFVREALGTTAAVLLGGMTFVLLNALLDRTLEGMAEAGKNVIAFGSGIVLASLLVPVKKRITDVLEKIQYHDTYRARRALLDIARDFATPRPREELVQAITRRVEEGLNVVPCTLFLFDERNGNGNADAPLLAERLADQDVWYLRGAMFGPEEPASARRLHAMGYRAFFAMRCGGGLTGALGVGHKDGRVPLSSEDEGLLSAVMAQASLAYENARLYGALAERLEEIRTLQQYQESIIRSSSSGIVVIGPDDRVQSANPAFAQIVGRTESDLVGLPFEEVLPGIEPEAAPSPEEDRTLEAKYATAEGEERDLRVSISPFQGSPDRRVVLVDDVTDRLRAERALAERERLAALGVLAAGVAHEVNTPIAGLSSYAQILLKDTEPEDPRYSILKKMERQTFRAAHLVNNLLEFARPRARSSVRTDLKQVLRNAAESVETAFGGRELSLELEADGSPVWVLGDPRELEQVFVNLLTNARDASPEGGRVTCSLRRDGSSAHVAVADRGRGLLPQDGEKLFRPFYTTKKSGGTGLGLAISREIVRRHGGDIGLSPREGGGVEAWVLLPA